jgi:hypothetical protein
MFIEKGICRQGLENAALCEKTGGCEKMGLN